MHFGKTGFYHEGHEGLKDLQNIFSMLRVRRNITKQLVAYCSSTGDLALNAVVTVPRRNKLAFPETHVTVPGTLAISGKMPSIPGWPFS